MYCSFVFVYSSVHYLHAVVCMYVICICLFNTYVSTGMATDIPGDFNVSVGNVTFSPSINLENPLLSGEVVFNDPVCVTSHYTLHYAALINAQNT